MERRIEKHKNGKDIRKWKWIKKDETGEKRLQKGKIKGNSPVFEHHVFYQASPSGRVAQVVIDS